MNNKGKKQTQKTVVNLQVKEPSEALKALLDGLTPDFVKLQEKVDGIFAKGREEGFEDMVIGDWVRGKMKDHYTDRTITRVLPETAKHMKHASKTKDEPDKMSGSETETDEDSPIIWQMKPEEYLLPDVETYDKSYLVKLVKYLDSEYTKQKFYVDKVDDLQDKVESLQNENKQLKARIQKLESGK